MTASSARSLFDAILLRFAAHLTRDNTDPSSYLAMVSTLYALAADTCGGEWVYVPQGNVVEREQARARIALALQAGEPTAQIAQREGVTDRHVRKLRGTIRT